MDLEEQVSVDIAESMCLLGGVFFLMLTRTC